jgi:hypothetical protein
MSDNQDRVAYIHIGPPKTGSTSIQHFFRHNRDELLRHKLLIPTVKNDMGKSMNNHFPLVKGKELKHDGTIRQNAVMWAQIDKHVKERDCNILLSSEIFADTFMTTDRFYPIARYFRKNGYRVVVLAYIRDQAGWLNSWYVQNQKRLFDQNTFDEYIAKAMASGRAAPHKFLKPFIDSPYCDLEVIPFERACMDGLELDFVRRLGIPSDAVLENTGLKNPNAGAKTVYAAQQIMRELVTKVHHLDRYGEGYRFFKRYCIKLGWNETPYNGLTQDRVDYVRKFFRAGNNTFAKQFFGTKWDEIVPEKQYVPSVFDYKAASIREQSEIDDVVFKTVQKFRKMRKLDKPQELTEFTSAHELAA